MVRLSGYGRRINRGRHLADNDRLTSSPPTTETATWQKYESLLKSFVMLAGLAVIVIPVIYKFVNLDSELKQAIKDRDETRSKLKQSQHEREDLQTQVIALKNSSDVEQKNTVIPWQTALTSCNGQLAPYAQNNQLLSEIRRLEEAQSRAPSSIMAFGVDRQDPQRAEAESKIARLQDRILSLQSKLNCESP